MEIINTKIPDGAATTVYRNGSVSFAAATSVARHSTPSDIVSFCCHSPFIDLCMGPHIPTTALIKSMKVFRHSAAYWMGDADNDSLQVGQSFNLRNFACVCCMRVFDVGRKILLVIGRV